MFHFNFRPDHAGYLKHAKIKVKIVRQRPSTKLQMSIIFCLTDPKSSVVGDDIVVQQNSHRGTSHSVLRIQNLQPLSNLCNDYIFHSIMRYFTWTTGFRDVRSLQRNFGLEATKVITAPMNVLRDKHTAAILAGDTILIDRHCWAAFEASQSVTVKRSETIAIQNLGETFGCLEK
jgi:hypothetical protein